MSAELAVFIQWKGTDVCCDLTCPKCGEHSHFDGFFMYVIECPHCLTKWEMPEHLVVVEVADP